MITLKMKRQFKFLLIFAAFGITYFGVHLFNTYCLESSILRYKILHEHSEEPVRSSDTKVVLFWTKFFKVPFWGMSRETYVEEELIELNCPNTNCIFTHNRKLLPSDQYYDAFIFHTAEAWNFVDLPKIRHPDQLYIMATLESPGETKHNLDYDHDFYNLTMTYRLDSDIDWFYGQVVDKSSGMIIAPAMNVKWREPDNDFYDKDIATYVAQKSSTAAWFVSHCKVNSERDMLTRELQKHIDDIDVYGKCGTLSCPQIRSAECIDMLNTTYKFYLSFENTLCVDYVTEKLFNIMNSYVVPIVYSGAEMSRFLPPKSYINANDYATAEDLAEYLIFLSENPREYIKFFWWKKHYKISSSGGTPLCAICEKLHEKNSKHKRQVYEDIQAWFYDGACIEPKIVF